jgi:hypothetical protein
MLYADITANNKKNKGLGDNELLEIVITTDNGKRNVAKINVFNNLVKQEILTTFQPLHCQEYDTDELSGKAIALATITRRYATAYDSGKKQKLKVK